MNKKGFEFSFGWLFSIIVGAAILVLAIYAVANIAGQERRISDTELAQQLGAILNPIETSLETDKIGSLIMPVESRIYNKCYVEGVFGSQEISVASKSGIGNEWERPGIADQQHNKYVFSEQIIEGKEFLFLSKSFDMPFKIGNIIIIWPEDEKYCFVSPPDEIEEDIEKYRRDNSKINASFSVSGFSSCKNESIKVCFSVAGLNSGCEINVNTNSKSVTKNGNTVYYEDDLLFGAIFSDSIVYECQIKRLMGRAGELALVYLGKTEMLAGKGCSSNLDNDLVSYAEAAKIKSSTDLRNIGFISEQIKEKNDKLSCKLF